MHIDTVKDRLTRREYNGLRAAGLLTLEEVQRTPDCDLLRIKGIGRKSLWGIRAATGAHEAGGQYELQYMLTAEETARAARVALHRYRRAGGRGRIRDVLLQALRAGLQDLSENLSAPNDSGR